MEHIVFTCRLFIVHVPVVFARDTFLVHEQLKMNQTGPLQSEKKNYLYHTVYQFMTFSIPFWEYDTANTY